MKNEKLSKEVMEMLNKSAEITSSFEHENFHQNNYFECLEIGMESPIEQILYVAFKVISQINYIEQMHPVELETGPILIGISLQPQFKLDPYRADFIGRYGKYVSNGQGCIKEVIVECDSQTFHERDEKERRYEKARDRFFIAKGYQSFHFTGTEIMREPYRVAAEIISHLTGQSVTDLMDPNYISV